MNAMQATYAPARVVPRDPVFLNAVGINGIGMWHLAARDGAATSNANTNNNRIIYVPFWLNAPYTVVRVFWLNGATVGTNNVQVGAYTEDFTQIFECTSTLSAGANAAQYVTLGAAVTLPRMRGYLAHWCAGTTATFLSFAGGSRARPLRYTETNASGLPATATPAADTDGVVPLFGITRRSSP